MHLCIICIWILLKFAVTVPATENDDRCLNIHITEAETSKTLQIGHEERDMKKQNNYLAIERFEWSFAILSLERCLPNWWGEEMTKKMKRMKWQNPYLNSLEKPFVLFAEKRFSPFLLFSFFLFTFPGNRKEVHKRLLNSEWVPAASRFQGLNYRLWCAILYFSDLEQQQN